MSHSQLSPHTDDAELADEAELAEVFRSVGYEVETMVGDQPGTVVWVATPAHGLIRPRTHFRLLSSLQDDIDRTLAALEATRVACGADRAIGIVRGNTLPVGYHPDLRVRHSNVLTIRRWLLELFGAIEGLESIVQSLEERAAHATYMPRRARLSTGEEVEVEAFLDTWLRDPARPRILVTGPENAGKTTVIEQAILRSTRQFLASPETEPLLIDLVRGSNPYSVALVAAKIAVAARSQAPLPWAVIPAKMGPPALAEHRDEDSPPESERLTSLELLPPTSEEVSAWFSRTLGASAATEKLRAAGVEIPGFAAFASWLPRLHIMADVIRRLPPADAELPLDAWMVAVVSACCDEVIRIWAELAERGTDDIQILEDAALWEFALGLVPSGQYMPRGAVPWLPAGARDWYDRKGKRFQNTLARDYFLARKVAREVEAGNSEILLRYQLPTLVFTFLARIAPDIAAHFTQDNVARLEAKVQEEVERKLYLTFAHHLGRPVGRMRAYLNELRDAIGREKAASLTRQFQGVHEEIDYLERLAEKTRLWGVSPEESLTGLTLAAMVADVAGPLREQFPTVEWSIEIPAGLLVQGMRNALRETLQCLLENAVHASLAVPAGEPRTPRVKAIACLLADVVRLEVRDNGLGIRESDRERIFEPLVTTKKGGRDKPRGTGLGLAIARRYAQHMGGKVGLDMSQTETCFYLELVHWKENDDAQR